MQIDDIFKEITNILAINKKDILHVRLVPNKNDYTIKIFDVVSIKIYLGKTNYIHIKSNMRDIIEDTTTFEHIKSNPNWIRSPIHSMPDIYKLENTIVAIYDSISLADPFGCCSFFNECSDALKCIRSDLRSKSCIYRNYNLEKGKVFYGKNKNI